MTHNKGHRSKQQLAGLISYMREGSTSRVCRGVKDVRRRGKASRRLAPHPPAAATWSRGNPHTGLESDTRTEIVHDAVTAVATWSQWGRLCSPCLQLAYNQRKLNRVLLTQCYSHKPLLRKECSCGTPYRLHKMLDSAQSGNSWQHWELFVHWEICLFISVLQQ